MSRRLPSWDDLARAQSTKFPFAMTLKDILEQAKNMDIIAARDRDSFDTPWRRVMLQKLSANIWLLLDEKGEVLDEPEDSCPSSGFSKETLFAEVGMEYYDFPIDQVDAQSKASDKLTTASDKLPTAADGCTEGVAGGSSASANAKPAPAPKPAQVPARPWPSISSVTPAFAPTTASSTATKIGDSLGSFDNDDEVDDEVLNAATDAAVAAVTVAVAANGGAQGVAQGRAQGTGAAQPPARRRGSDDSVRPAELCLWRWRTACGDGGDRR